MQPLAVATLVCVWIVASSAGSFMVTVDGLDTPNGQNYYLEIVLDSSLNVNSDAEKLRFFEANSADLPAWKPFWTLGQVNTTSCALGETIVAIPVYSGDSTYGDDMTWACENVATFLDNNCKATFRNTTNNAEVQLDSCWSGKLAWDECTENFTGVGPHISSFDVTVDNDLTVEVTGPCKLIVFENSGFTGDVQEITSEMGEVNITWFRKSNSNHIGSLYMVGLNHDRDELLEKTCSEGKTRTYNTTSETWTCEYLDDPYYIYTTNTDCTSGDHLEYGAASTTTCEVDSDTISLPATGCSGSNRGLIYNGGDNWVCAGGTADAADSDILGDLQCGYGEIAVYNAVSNALECRPDEDHLKYYACPKGMLLRAENPSGTFGPSWYCDFDRDHLGSLTRVGGGACEMGDTAKLTCVTTIGVTCSWNCIAQPTVSSRAVGRGVNYIFFGTTITGQTTEQEILTDELPFVGDSAMLPAQYRDGQILSITATLSRTLEATEYIDIMATVNGKASYLLITDAPVTLRIRPDSTEDPMTSDGLHSYHTSISVMDGGTYEAGDVVGAEVHAFIHPIHTQEPVEITIGLLITT